jgi:hypothetical protein
MFIETEQHVVQDSYTEEEITGILLLIAIKQNYIKRENLTDKGEMLVTKAEQRESRDGYH